MQALILLPIASCSKDQQASFNYPFSRRARARRIWSASRETILHHDDFEISSSRRHQGNERKNTIYVDTFIRQHIAAGFLSACIRIFKVHIATILPLMSTIRLCQCSRVAFPSYHRIWRPKVHLGHITRDRAIDIRDHGLRKRVVELCTTSQYWSPVND